MRPTGQADDPLPRLEHVVPLVVPPPPPARVAVAVIGGGIMGVSIAYHLAEAGVDDVLVIERDTLGSGSSAKPLGGVRATFSDANNVLLGQRSLAAYEDFEARFGTAIGLRQVGYLFLCRTEAELTAVEASVRLQNALGGDSRMISSDAGVRAQSVPAAECLARGVLLAPGRLRRAGPGGRRLRDRGPTAGRDLRRAHRGARRRSRSATARHQVSTQRGTVRADTVVIAAGAWSTRIGAMLGVHLPIEGVRRQIGFTAQQARAHPTVPFTLDLSTTLYFHNYRNGLLLGISNPDEEVGLCREFSYGWTRAFDEAAAVVAPTLVGRPLVGGWAGLYENTPDHNALIGRARVPGVLYATGFSGHGFLQGPAVGEIIRDLYLDREPFLDPSPFSADRFDESGSLLHEVHII